MISEWNEHSGEREPTCYANLRFDNDRVMTWHEHYDVDYPSVESPKSFDRIRFTFSSRGRIVAVT